MNNLHKLIVESIQGNPAEIADALKEELKNRVFEAIEKVRLVKEETLGEGMRLAKGQSISHDPEAEPFAKEYVKGKKADYMEGGNFTDKQAQDAEKFGEKYKHKVIRHGFGGSGTHHYTNKETGETHEVRISSNGKGFWGSNHHISKVSS